MVVRDEGEEELLFLPTADLTHMVFASLMPAGSSHCLGKPSRTRTGPHPGRSVCD